MKTMITLVILAAFAISCSTSGKKGAPADTAGTQSQVSPTPTSDAAKSSAAKPATEATADSITCKNGSDERKINVQKEGTGCEVLYSKFNETNSIASAANGTSHCEEVSQRVRSNLEGAGFKCEE